MPKANKSGKHQKTAAQRRREAYEILEVKEKDVETAPKIGHLLAGIGGFQLVKGEDPKSDPGGFGMVREPDSFSPRGIAADRARILEYLAGSEEPEARKILEYYKRLPGYVAKLLPIEAFCVAAGVSTKKAFGLIAQETIDQSGKAGALLARAAHPQVVQATIEQALTPAGVQDRKFLHQSQGFLPLPKTQVLNVYGNAAIDQRRQTANVAVLPPVEDSIRRLSDRFNDVMMAPAIAALPPPEDIIDAEEDEE